MQGQGGVPRQDLVLWDSRAQTCVAVWSTDSTGETGPESRSPNLLDSSGLNKSGLVSSSQGDRL